MPCARRGSARFNVAMAKPRFFVATLAAILLVAQLAFADEPTVPRKAMELFEQAGQAYDAGEFVEAVPLYEKALEIYPAGLGIRVALGLCLEKMGRFARAYETMRDVVAQATAQEEEASRTRSLIKRDKAKGRRQEAETAMRRLEANLGWVEIDIAPGAAKMANREVLCDGIKIDETARVPVDPGSHTFVARASGKTFWSKTLDVPQAGFSTRLIIDVTVPPPNRSKQRIVGFVLGGVGVVAAGGAVGFGVDSYNRREASIKARHCDPNGMCDSVGANDGSISARNTAIGFGIGSGVLVAAGLTIILTASRAPAPPAVALFVGPNGIVVRGRF